MIGLIHAGGLCFGEDVFIAPGPLVGVLAILNPKEFTHPVEDKPSMVGAWGYIVSRVVKI